MADQELVEVLARMREILTRAKAYHVVEMIEEIVALLDRDTTTAALKLVSWGFWRELTDVGIEGRYFSVAAYSPEEAYRDSLEFDKLQCMLIDAIGRLGYATNWRDRMKMRSLKRAAKRGIRYLSTHSYH